MARCPGQDQRFWKPEDIFEIKCPVCGTSVEFWKDEPQVKCPNCKHDIVNPKLDLGCTKWCQYAEECLGTTAKHENTLLSSKFIKCLRQIAGSNQSIIRDSLETLRYAEIIQGREGGEPLVVKASAIFSQVYKKPLNGGLENSNENTAINQETNMCDILTKYGVKNDLIDHVCRILDTCQSAKSIDSLEFNIIWDSCQLTRLHQQTTIKGKTTMKISWKTETGRHLARGLTGE